MKSTITGLNVMRATVTQPAQWHLLLVLAMGPRTSLALWQEVPWQRKWQYFSALVRLQRHQLVMFHMKQRCWTLTATGETLRPVLSAIQKCSEVKGESSNDV
ncbi:hypothetical protein [Levilactobacillus yonginensis]|uniref:hypothetical protein n=1 Tax=Levilactobacillus yonginensis TaxID=1054041 RepID=UPI00345D30D3